MGRGGVKRERELEIDREKRTLEGEKREQGVEKGEREIERKRKNVDKEIKVERKWLRERGSEKC
jgi:hypothetical protein